MVSRSRRKVRAYLHGSNPECVGCGDNRGKGRGGLYHQRIWLPFFRWQSEVISDPFEGRAPRMDCWESSSRHWWHTTNVVLNHWPLLTLDDLFVEVHRAEKSRRPRRRKRGLRRGKRRSRECHSRRSVASPARPSKPPNMRRVNHRRRPERWLIVASERLRADAKKFVQLKGDGYWVSKRRRSQKLYCMTKWSRLSSRANQLGFPPKLSFDTSFFKWLNKEFPKNVSEVDEHALLYTKQPFTYFDPPEPFDPVLALLNSGTSSGKRPTRGAIRGPGTRKAPCRHCGNVCRPGGCPKLRSRN